MTKRSLGEAFQYSESNINKKIKIELSYFKFVTNNFHRLNFYKFGYCIFCKNKVQADKIKQICDVSTAICYHCGSDSIVPGECNRHLLNRWYQEGFNN